MKTIKVTIETNPGVTPILHSDHGFQYTSKEYVREISKAGITRSMSRVVRCIDSAPMESSGAILRTSTTMIILS
ncbi:DDE-type integrase/transposase/recombinase [Lactobacillus salivarius]|uniref:hypothetical protein n=1 Tax=Ligilactobacillus salivarius TaxID=1624 RepID=UPI00136B4944|nr:hypothetical protein [Ligilactobacillus salivarius]MYV21099.1 DDE-type integrase/transposase/recombinase [Ligilactobacillus salivarius]